jgi:tetratricopeptide (TPR) repeat protein
MPSMRLAKLRHGAYYWSVADAADRMYHQGGEDLRRGLALFDEEWSNIQAGQEWVAQNAPYDDVAAEMCSFYANECASLIALRQHARIWINWLEAALAAAQRIGLDNAVAMHTGNLGAANAQLGETKQAIRYFRKHLALSRRNSSREAEQSAIANLGIMYRNCGQVRRAIRFFEKSLELAMELRNKAAEANALGNLGTAYAAV